MRQIILFLILISGLFAQRPIIKVEGQDLLKALAYTEGSSYVKLYDWSIGDGSISIVEWDPNGNNWTPQGFERKGKVYLSNQGKITHTIVGSEAKPGYWNLQMLGNKDKIIKVTLSPNSVTMENPSIKIDKAYIKEKIVCKENSALKDTAYLVKFPQKLSFWIEEKTAISTQGNKSEYVITYDKKPECASKSEKQQKSISKKIDESTKEQIKFFLKSFYKTGEESFPAKALRYYDSKVDQYFALRNVTKEDILEDKIRYYKKWTTRKYSLKDFEIIDSYIADSIQYYVVNTAVDWNVTSAKGKSRQGTSYNLVTLVETDNGFLIKSIKSIGDSDQKPHQQNDQPIVDKNYNHSISESQVPKQKTISFEENGIHIYLTYPRNVKAGENFKIRAEMTNYNRSAKQGGLTLSFPDMISMRGRVLSNNFSSLRGYSTPDKIYNKNTRRSMIAKYFMVEGWQSKTWRYGQTKYFTVELRAPKGIDELLVNVRGVLWIRSKHDLRKVPSRSGIYDQQGFPVKQFSIHIN